MEADREDTTKTKKTNDPRTSISHRNTSEAYRKFGLGHMTLKDKYPSGGATSLCSRYSSRMETKRLDSGTCRNTLA